MATPPPSLPKDIKGFCSLTCEPYKQTQQEHLPFCSNTSMHYFLVAKGTAQCTPSWKMEVKPQYPFRRNYALLAQHGLTNYSALSPVCRPMPQYWEL